MVDAVALVIACVVGTGIFFVPQQVAGSIASPGLVLLLWLACGIICLCGALSLAELGSHFPDEGGVYTYLRKIYGGAAGFCYGWTSILITNSAVMAVLATAFSTFFIYLFPQFSSAGLYVGIAVILLLALVNTAGIKTGKRVTNFLTAMKLAGILALIVLVFSRQGGWSPGLLSIQTGDWPGWASVGTAVVAIMWTFDGWSYVGFSGAEMKRPKKTLPRALGAGILCVVVIYLLLNLAYYTALGVEQIGSSEYVATAALQKYFGGSASALMAILILVTLLGSLNALLMTGTRCYVAMGRDHSLLRFFAQINSASGVPVRAVFAQSLLAIIYLVIGKFYELLNMTVVANWLFYAALGAGLILMRVRKPRMEKSYRTPFYPWTPLLFLAFSLVIVSLTIISNPLYAGAALVIIGTGIPLYVYQRRKTGRETTSNQQFP